MPLTPQTIFLSGNRFLKKGFWLVAGFLMLASCRQPTTSSSASPTTATNPTAPTAGSPKDTTAVANATQSTLVLPGDFADPSVTKVGNTYWATATSSEWAPLFPLLKSNNLTDWTMVGHVFPENPPDWANAHFWAPEISYENGKVYIYYVGGKKGGPLCVGVASADHPEGPYKDHGPLVCQDAGAIDGFPMRDDAGQLYLIWKEDGNSRKQPTPIWGQRMNEERTALIGEKFELFRNDKPWEGGLVEGVSMIRRGEYMYAFYAGDACCGRGCTYATGVARAKKLTGPWEKYAGNPILRQNADWQCPGHGTVITDAAGKYYFLYHAYNTKSFVYPGRQGILQEFTWTADGWPHFDNQPAKPTGVSELIQDQTAREEFSENALSNYWQWPVNQSATTKAATFQNGWLVLNTTPDQLGTVVARRTLGNDYTASTQVDPATIAAGSSAGLAVIGDTDNAIGISVNAQAVQVWQVIKGQQKTVAQESLPAKGPVQLRMEAKEGHLFQFAWSLDGKEWKRLNGNSPLEGDYLPPWDRGVRVGLVAKGPATGSAAFDWFSMR